MLPRERSRMAKRPAPSAAYEAAISVDDVPMTSAVLTAAARHLGEYCKAENVAYAECYEANGRGAKPGACMDQNVKVTRCAHKL